MSNLPYLGRSAPGFAFLVHYRDWEDLECISASRFMKVHSSSTLDYRKRMCQLEPLVIGQIKVRDTAMAGDVICIPRMPREILSREGRKLIADALATCLRRGCRVVGLGALTAPATAGGVLLRSQIPHGAVVTNGNALTAAIIRQQVRTLAQLHHGGRRIRVCVVGCTGSVGVAASILLAREGFGLHLVGRSAERARALLADSCGSHEFGAADADLSKNDVVVQLVAQQFSQLEAARLKKGAVVLDCAQPWGISRDALHTFASHGITVYEGGLVNIPGYSSTIDFRTPDVLSTYSCLAETYLFARFGIPVSSLGRPSADLALQLEQLAGDSDIASALTTPLQVA